MLRILARLGLCKSKQDSTKFINHYSLFTLVLLFSISTYAVETVAPADPNWGLDPVTGTLMQPGISVMTQGTLISPGPTDGDHAFKMYDTRAIVPLNARPLLAPDVHTHNHWDVGSIGNVFGIAFDNDRNIYVSASTHFGATYGWQSDDAIINFGSIGAGVAGDSAGTDNNPGDLNNLAAAGTIYRLDAVTGDASIFVQLPQQAFNFTNVGCEAPAASVARNTGPALGNINYDSIHNQFFVSNFEDGKIYRLDSAGTVLSTYDPFLDDDGTAGLAPDERPYGLVVNLDATMLYFGTHKTDLTPRLFAIPLDPNGEFTGVINGAGSFSDAEINQNATLGTDLAYTQTVGGGFTAGGWVSYSDLKFSPQGELMVGVRTGCQNNFATSHNHGGTFYLLVPDGTGLYNTPAPQVPGDPGGANAYDAGSFPIQYTGDTLGPGDGYGGIGIYDKGDGTYDYLVTSADIVDEPGPHGFLLFPHDFTATGNNTTQYIINPGASFSAYPSSTTTGGDYKGSGGDIEVLSVLLDWGDAPDTYSTNLVVGDAIGGLDTRGPSHILTSEGIWLGLTVDAEFNGIPSIGADSDDNHQLPDDEDGISAFPVLLTTDTAYTIPIANISAANGSGGIVTIHAWIDFDGSGQFDADEYASTTVNNAAIVPNTALTWLGAGVSGMSGGATYARFRITNDAGIAAATPAGVALNGEIEDYVLNIIPVQDWGDAPDPAYPTLAANNGPRHTLSSALFMGACVDNEPDGQQSVVANGDDTGVAANVTHGICTSANDDEDSLVAPNLADSQVAPTVTVTTVNTTGIDATLACWVDYNGDGAFDNATERGFVTVANGVTSAIVTLPNVPATASADTGGSTFMRCRIASLPADVANATGVAINGEVEDYPISLASVYTLGDYVWYDTNQDGVQDASELGVNGIDVALYNNATCTGIAVSNTTTINGGTPAADGFYEFTALVAGDYCVEFTSIPVGYDISPTGAGTAATDSDANPATGQVQNIALSADDPDNDMGISLDGSISGLTWCESANTANTTYDMADGDILLADIQITLYEDTDCSNTVNGAEAGTAITQDTNATGDYLFSNLPVGLAPAQVCYITEVNQADLDLNACDGIITTGTLVPDLDTNNPDSTNNNFGFDDNLTLGNYVWYDANQDGIQDASEVGVNGIDVTLYNNATCTPPLMSSTTTATNGNDGFYEFTNLDVGTYCLEFTNTPAGYTISPTGNGTAATDSDADTGGLIQNIVLNADNPDEDMGLYVSGTVSGLVWCESDTNANTSYDAGDADTLQSNIGVTLYEDTNCNDALDGAEAATAITQDTVAGLYSFNNLITGGPGAGNNPPGCYIVQVDATDPDLGVCDNPITPAILTPDIDAPNPNSPDNNFGHDEQLVLGDYVWYDFNQDGVQDVGEPGINGITVNLYTTADCSGVVSQSTSTATNVNDGYYQFSPLASGDYCVEFIPSIGHTISPTGAGTSATDSDADTVTGQVQNIDLQASDQTIDMGVFVAGSVSGLLWCESDTNANVTYDAGDGDTLQSNIAVILYEDTNCNDTLDGAEVTTAITQDTVAGLYSFNNLITGGPGAGNNPPGCYIVQVDATDPDLGVCDNSITPAILTPDIDAPNPNSPDNNFGHNEELSLGDYVWYDSNQDGVQDAGEPGINGVTVNLYPNANCTGAIAQTTVTANVGSDGFYQFTPLASGMYCVEFIPPAGHTISPTGAGTPATDSNADINGQVQNINLQDSDITIDMGVFVPGSVSGLLWCESDTNANVTYDAGDGDTLQSNIAVILYEDTNCNDTLDGVEAATAITQDTVAGLYSFNNLITGGPGAGNNPPGCYIVQVDAADPDLGACDNPITPAILTPDIDAPNPNSPDNNFGHNEELSLGDYVWYDSNQDGVQDAGEPGINGVTVNLYPNANCTGAIAQTTVTANVGSDGFYQFTPLASGMYCVEFIPPAGHTISPTGAGTPATDSNADINGQVQNINLQDSDITIDMGVFVPGSVSGLLWCESDTNANVTYDAGDADTLQSNVAVILYEDTNCNDTLDGVEAATAITQDTVTGLYSFNNLITGGPDAGNNPPGCYIVQVDATDPDLGVCDNPITPAILTPDIDAPNPNSPDNNFGHNEELSLGDYVWYDSNQDGVQDAGEPGINGVTVNLYPNANCTGAIAQTTVTANVGSDGFYQFTPLASGMYCVEFVPPIGHNISPTGAGTPSTDSDADVTGQVQNIDLQATDQTIDMGVFVVGTISGLVWCESGTNPNISYNAGDGDTLQSNVTVTLYDDTDCNDTLDGAEAATAVTQDTVAGLYSFSNLITGGPNAGDNPPGCYIVQVDTADPDLGVCSNPVTPSISTPDIDAPNPNSPDNNFGHDETLTLGDTVWYDNNQDGIQDIGEPGVNGITVTLYDNPNCSGASVQTTTTAMGGMPAADGWYEFSPLPSGDYCIEFTNLPGGWVFTPENQGVDDTVDSDANPATGQITNIDLQSNNPNEGVGIYAATGTISGNMFCDYSPVNGTEDAGEEQADLTINLYRDTDCDGTGDTLYRSQETDINGDYIFSNVPVAFAPAPPNPQVCYVVAYDPQDPDLGDCTTPILPEEGIIELTTDAPDAPAVTFGTTPPAPIMIPTNNIWGLLLLIGLMLMFVRRRYQVR